MSSSLRVNTIVPSTGTNVAIGTANGTVTFTDSVNFVLGTGSSIFSPASNTLTFGTNDAERLRITSAGNLGIGDASPTKPLTVGTTTPVILLDDQSSRTLEIRGPSTTHVASILTTSGHALLLGTYNSERLRITSAGKIGVNETAPAADLVVKQSGNTFTTQSQTVALFQRSSTAGHGAKIAIVAGTGGSSDINFGDTADEDIGSIQYYHTDDSLRFITNTAERLRITDAGMVGINMTPSATGSSTYMLQMYNAGSQCFMSIGQGSSGNGPLHGLVMGVSNAAHYITGRENRPMIFATNDTERMRIDTSGRLLLTSGTDVRIELGTTGSTGTNNRNHLRGDGANMKYNCCSGGGHFFEANGGERMRISSNGHVNIGDGYIVSNTGLHVGRGSGGTAAGESVLAATLGDYSTMVSALLTVKNAGNRGAQGATGGSPLAKFEFNNGTAFEIDKNGYRTLPYQPCAMAYNAQGQHMAGGSVAEFNSTRFNIGNMYNSSNGRMTVPVSGRYLVAYSGLHDYVSQNNVGFDIRINGSTFNGGEGYQSGSNISNTQLSKTLILVLSANDYVDIYIRQSGTQVHQRYGSFTVTLLT